MSSVTSPQQTDRRGSDEIPGPRCGQGVRLLVLGADPEAQTLRDQATAAGYELAQRYSARVSHVAYGTGVDPGDARYTKIRDAGLVLLPLQKCAEELGLGRAHMMDTDAETGAEPETEARVEAVTGSGTLADVEAEAEVGVAVGITAELTVELTVEPEYEADDAPLEIPPLHPVAEAIEATEAADVAAAIIEEPVEVEVGAEIADGVSATAFVPGFADEVTGVPLGAAVIGADPWIGGADSNEDAAAAEIPHPHRRPRPVLDPVGPDPLRDLRPAVPLHLRVRRVPPAFPGARADGRRVHDRGRGVLRALRGTAALGHSLGHDGGASDALFGGDVDRWHAARREHPDESVRALAQTLDPLSR